MQQWKGLGKVRKELSKTTAFSCVRDLTVGVYSWCMGEKGAVVDFVQGLAEDLKSLLALSLPLKYVA